MSRDLGDAEDEACGYAMALGMASEEVAEAQAITRFWCSRYEDMCRAHAASVEQLARAHRNHRAELDERTETYRVKVEELEDRLEALAEELWVERTEAETWYERAHYAAKILKDLLDRGVVKFAGGVGP